MSNSILGSAPEDGDIIQAYGAHTMALRDLYKKAHWQTSGATFYGLHLVRGRAPADARRTSLADLASP